MIQRIQSIYLLVAAILMAATVFSPLFYFAADKSAVVVTFYSCGIANKAGMGSATTWGILFFAILGSLLSLINIFLFKKRKIQQKIGTVTSLVILFFYITTYVYYQVYITHENIKPEHGIILPAIALLLNILAILRIKKDEKLVQSLNRIR